MLLYVKPVLLNSLQHNPDLTTLRKKPFENIVGKGENAGNQHFLFFPQCFLPFPKQISIFDTHSNCRLQILSIWTGLTKILSFGKELPGFTKSFILTSLRKKPYAMIYDNRYKGT